MTKLTIKSNKMVDTSAMLKACEISHRNTEYKCRINALRNQVETLERELTEEIRKRNADANYDPMILREVQNLAATLGALTTAKGALNGAYMA